MPIRQAEHPERAKEGTAVATLPTFVHILVADIFAGRAPRLAGARIALALAVCAASCQTFRAQTGTSQGPELFTYDELVRLYEEEPLPDALRQKLGRLRMTPVVSNTAAARGARPLKPDVPKLGRVLRVAAWNIERGLNFNAVRAALLGSEQLARLLDKKRYPPGSAARADILRQASLLRQSDVIVLNEVDWGVKRTDYRDVARELASALGMNYAWGVEFVEVDPLATGTETFDEVDAAERAALVRNIAVDKLRARNLHGTAILSRYPLTNVRLVPFEHQGYDWYAGELKKVSKLEEGKRKGSALVFGEKITREVRRGGRMMLLADIEDADIPGGRVTVVATHLEDKSKPEERVEQLEELLSYIKDIPNPVVVTGDMNTSGSDATPISFDRAVKQRMGSASFWVNKGVKYATGVGLLYDVTLGAVKRRRTKNDPTVKSVRFVSENPEENFFTTLKGFRFADGGAFDFRGAEEFSVGGRQDTLSDSNERDSKGFVSTFELEGKITVELKLDWIFVKPARLNDPDDRAQGHLFAPRFGRTLKALNYGVKGRISDHNPIVADLPFAEPRAR
jgi:endonuclease/exonuclease/phosphatase family metal-dependent hydrolase